MMNIKTFYLGSMMTNCYITWNDDKIAYLFDCGGENIDKIMTFLKVNGLTLKYLILTHGHGDHIAGINRLVEEYPNVEVYKRRCCMPYRTRIKFNEIYYRSKFCF